MHVNISCDTFLRLSHIAANVNPRYPWLQSVGLHRAGGRLCAVASDARFFAAEFIAMQPGEPDDFAFVSIDPAIIKQCELERSFNGLVTVRKDDAQQYTHVSTSFGYVHPSNAGLFPIDENHLLKWRDWIGKPVKHTNGCMFFEADGMASLARSAPSGKIVFPKYQDVFKAIVVQDVVSSNWIGVFYPKTKNEEIVEFSEFADWMKE